MSPSTAFLSALASRRSIYTLTSTSPIPPSTLQSIITSALLHTPTSFNSQSTRIVLLLEAEHRKLWDIATETLRGVVPAEQFGKTAQRLAGFAAAYGTVLFFEDRDAVRGMQEKFAIYAERFPGWADQSAGMTQLAIWTAFELEGLGANLQHYNPLIDAKVAKEWDIPESWVLNAQLVFGAPTGEPGEKTFLGVEERFRVHGA